MGIPSYYKRLVERFPRLVRKGFKTIDSDILLMDFNCLIYQCLRDKGMPAYTAESRAAWERALLEGVKEYTRKVWATAGKPSKVFIGVDGVVPMAKIRQQRLRRFKSRWLAATEVEAGLRKEESWDTNAITPGTEFMEKLGVALRDLASKHTGWAVSAADEPGEGEQKLMAWVRANRNLVAKKRVVVYGLDADLIVLSLIGTAKEVPSVAEWNLLRELTEFEGKSSPDDVFACLDIVQLLGILTANRGMSPADYVLEYTCGMSFLGNDFLPHSLSVRMKDGGHETMSYTLDALHKAGLRLVIDGVVQRQACLELVRRWAVDEEVAIERGFDQKYKMRPMPPRNERERLMADVENLPIRLRAESCLWGRAGLFPGWWNTYRREWLKEATEAQVGAQYELGLQWIMDYYLGRPVSYSWYFPWSVPPLWADLVGQFAAGSAGLAAPEPSSPVAPQEQLAMVLPMSSWWLVRNPKLRALPLAAPVFWPKSFGFFSAGRRWLWECEPEIPVMGVERLRQLV